MASLGDGGLAHQDVLNQTGSHTDSGQTEAPVEALHSPDPAGEQWAEQGTDIDAHVEDGEAGVTTRVVLGVELTQHDLCVGLHAAGADCDGDKANSQANHAGDECQGDVAKHDQDGGVEQCPLRAKDTVGNQRGNECGHVDKTAVSTDDGGSSTLVQAETALSGLVVHVESQDGLHAVEAEALPHFDAEEVGETPRLAHERAFFAGPCGVMISLGLSSWLIAESLVRRFVHSSIIEA